MSKTWYGHYIENIKGEDYVLFKDYLELGKEIEELKAKLEMYENGVYFSSENDELQQRIDKAREYINDNCYPSTLTHEYIFSPKHLINILQGSDKE